MSSGGGGGACFIVVAPVQWRYHNTPYLAVPVTERQSREPLDVTSLLGNDRGDGVQTFTVTWNDGSGVGIEFHTLAGCGWNPGTRAVMEELGIEVSSSDGDDDDKEAAAVVCTIVTQPGKLPLSREIYEWFSRQCKRSLY